MKIINFQKKNMTPLTSKSLNHIIVKKNAIFAKRSLKTNMLILKQYCKVIDHCHYTGKCRGSVRGIFKLKYSISKEVLIVAHDEPNYEYHFIMRELAKQF